MYILLYIKRFTTDRLLSSHRHWNRPWQRRSQGPDQFHWGSGAVFPTWIDDIFVDMDYPFRLWQPMDFSGNFLENSQVIYGHHIYPIYQVILDLDKSGILFLANWCFPLVFTSVFGTWMRKKRGFSHLKNLHLILGDLQGFPHTNRRASASCFVRSESICSIN